MDNNDEAEIAMSLSENEVTTTNRDGCTTRVRSVTNVEIETKAEKPGKNAEAKLTLEDGTVLDVAAYTGGETLEVFVNDADQAEYYDAADDGKTTEEIVVGCP